MKTHFVYTSIYFIIIIWKYSNPPYKAITSAVKNMAL